MANSIPQLAWMTDETGYIFWFNQRWYDYTGSDIKSMQGWGWREVHHPDHVNRVVNTFKKHIKNGEEWEDTFPLRGADGEYRWFLSRAKPIHNQAGEIVRWFGTNTDITRQLEQEQNLRENETKLRLALDSGDYGFFEYYTNHENTYWDEKLREIWGLDSDESPTQQIFWGGMHPDDRDMVREKLNAANNMSEGGHYHAVYRVINRKTQAIHWVEANGQIVAEKNAPLKMIGMAADITQQKDLELSLKEAIQNLEEQDTRKNEFLAVLGHELRNPLAAINGFVGIMDRKLRPAEEMLPAMKNSIQTMARLLDELLDLGRIARGRIMLESQPLDLAPILHSALLNIEKRCDEKFQELVSDISGSLYMEGDVTRLEQIFANLLNNASKFTPEGCKITLSAKREDQEIIVRIIDEGMGIAQDKIDKIFDPFFQVTPDAKASSGLGIGLALSKNLTELHGGRIAASSNGKNKGSTFEVRLPVLRDDVKIPSQVSPETSNTLPSGIKIVVVEDNPELLKSYKVLLESLGCHVHMAERADNGVALVKKHKPDAVFMDLGLPDMTGYDAAKLLREAGYENLLVAISGYGHDEAHTKALESGFDAHLAKPVQITKITKLLAEHAK